MSFKKIITLAVCLMMTAIVILGLASCTKNECKHSFDEWETVREASCTAEGERTRKCTSCGETETESTDKIAHTFKDATCTDKKTCTVCGLTDGEANGHTFKDATCTDKKTCTVCGLTDGEANGHTWLDATCTDPKTCSVCGLTEGEPLGGDGHRGGEANCTEGAVCDICGAEYQPALGHIFDDGEIIAEAGCTEDGSVKYTCTVCEDVKTETVAAIGHKYVDTVVAPNCNDGGYTEHVCSECGHKYVDTVTDALGHDWNLDAPTCEENRECSRCDAMTPALGHSYTSSVKAPGCETDGYTEHVCEICGDSYRDTEIPAFGHDITGVTAIEEPLEGTTCIFALTYTCKTCSSKVTLETVVHHTYKASLSREATCSSDGEKILTCSGCGDSKTEAIPMNESAHSWQIGETVGVKRIDTCSICGQEKTVTVVEGNVTPSTNAGDLKDTEIEMDNANISLDNGVIDSIGDKDIVISADKLEGDARPSAGLTTDQLGQIGDSPVYNFTMNDGNGNISNFGEDNYITITIPYTLTENDDLDNIAIWFITDEGELEAFRATYSDGYVTFKTNHFSYYTVTRLTPRERCEVYGHEYVETNVALTCTTDGYDLFACIRCSDTLKKNVVKAEGHKHVADTVPATCTAPGTVTYTCSCGHTYSTVLSALGHDFAITESVESTCITSGYDRFGCTRCDKEYSSYKNKLPHNMSASVVAPTCTEAGYTENSCSGCDLYYKDREVAPLGHDFSLVWQWSEDFASAKLVKVCANDAAHNVEYAADVTSETIVGEFDKVEYTAKVTVDGVEYTDVKVEVLGEHVHSYTGIGYDGSNHWRSCACGDRSEIEAHEWQNGDTVKAPTCLEEGLVNVFCSCGMESVLTLPKTDDHTYADGVCTVCGEAKKEDFYINLVTSPFVTDGVGVKVDGLDFEAIEKFIDGSYEITGRISQTELAELTLNYVDGELVAFMHGTVKIFNGPIEDEWAPMGARVAVTGEYVYIEYFGDENGSEKRNYAKIEADELVKVWFAQVTRSSNEAAFETLKFLVDNGLFEILSDAQKYTEDINGILEVLMNALFARTECDGGYEFTLDFEKINLLNEKLSVMSISELIDNYFGEGTSDKIVDFVSGLADMKLSEIENYVKELGFDAEAILDLIDEMYVFMGAEEVDIREFIRENGNVTVGQMMYGDEYAEILESIKDDLCEYTFYELLPVSKMMIDEIIDCCNGHVLLTVKTDSDGYIKSVSFELDKWTPPTPDSSNSTFENSINIKIDITLGATEGLEIPADLISKIDSLAPDYTPEEKIDEDADEVGGRIEYNGAYHDFYGVRCEYSISNADSFIGFAVMPDCGAWGNYQMLLVNNAVSYTIGIIDDESTGEDRIYLIINDLTGEMVTYEMNGDSLTVTYSDGTTRSFVQTDYEDMYYLLGAIFGQEPERNYRGADSDMVYYNTETGEIATVSQHNYTYTHDDVRYCDDGYNLSYSCDKCGDSGSVFKRGHFTVEKTLDLSYLGKCSLVTYRECVVCGTHESFYDRCNYMTSESPNGGGPSRSVCGSCGISRLSTSSMSEKDENCYTIRNITYVWQNDSGESFTFERKMIEQSHDFLETFELLGVTCEDGVRVTRVCRDCGFAPESYINHYHNITSEEIYGSDYGCCDRHYIYVNYCPCGRYFNYSFNRYDFDYVTEDGVHGCNSCDMKAIYSENKTILEGCVASLQRSVVVKVGDNVILNVAVNSEFENHNFEYSVESRDGLSVMRSYCSDCGYSKTVEAYTGTIEWDGSGESYYDFRYTPDVSGRYVIESLSRFDPYVILYLVGEDGSLIEIDRNDDGSSNNNFKLKAMLDAGVNYVFRIKCYGGGGDGTTVMFSFGPDSGSSSDIECNHVFTEEKYKYFGESCYDGVEYVRACVSCGLIIDYRYEENHMSVDYVEIGFEKYGADWGYIYYYECHCGEKFNVRYGLPGQQTSNEYTTDDGYTGFVIRIINECGLKLQDTYYSVPDEANCVERVYHSLVIHAGSELIFSADYVEERELHDYEITYQFDGAANCEEGVTLYYVCRRCGSDRSSHYTWHYTYTVEKLNLKDYGSTCNGYIEFLSCACGASTNIDDSHAQCDIYAYSTDMWVDDYVESGWYRNIYGEYYYDCFANICKCAVTDPVQCKFAYRYTRYWKLDADKCVATCYTVYQFGYDDVSGTYDREIVFVGQSRPFHDFEYTYYTVDVDGKDGYIYRCSRCESIISYECYYDSEGQITKEIELRTNVPHNGFAKSYQHINNYDTNSDGERYCSYEYTEWVYADGSVDYTESEIYEESVDAPFGHDAKKRVETVKSSDPNENYYREEIFTYYSGVSSYDYKYTLYLYTERQRSDGLYWEKYEYTYSFENGCYRYTVYTNSHNVHEESEGECHYYGTTVTIKPYTCTQSGIAGEKCDVCDRIYYEYETSPAAHYWSYHPAGWYYCNKCGLENINGASGGIVMEDLTVEYGADTHYVVGYWNRDMVEYRYYVCLVLKNAEEGENDQVILSGITFTELENVRAISFSRDEVIRAAEALGYGVDDYDVRFVFVPEGADGSFDYAVTFSDYENADEITDAGSYKLFCTSREGNYVTITNTGDEKKMFRIYIASDVGCDFSVYDKNGYYYGDYSSYWFGSRFGVDVWVEAGESVMLYVYPDLYDRAYAYIKFFVK